MQKALVKLPMTIGAQCNQIIECVHNSYRSILREIIYWSYVADFNVLGVATIVTAFRFVGFEIDLSSQSPYARIDLVRTYILCSSNRSGLPINNLGIAVVAVLSSRRNLRTANATS